MNTSEKFTVNRIWLGRCRKAGCRTAFRVVIPTEITRWTYISSTTGMQKRQQSEVPSSRTPDLCCREHRRPICFSLVQGRKNDTACDSRCTSARGHNCECSCGGANHGCDHDLSKFFNFGTAGKGTGAPGPQ